MDRIFFQNVRELLRRRDALREENECPKGIRIPDLFSALNTHEAFHNWNTGYYYNNVITGGGHGKASDCIECGKCEKVCPQHLEIRILLGIVVETFE